jgi:hypothetical protein
VFFKRAKVRSISQQLDAYVLEDTSVSGYSMVCDAVSPALPPFTAQKRDSANYLQPLPGKSPRQSTTNVRSSQSNPKSSSNCGSGCHLDHADYVTGSFYADAKLAPFRARQQSADLWTPRRIKQPSSRYRPVSMQLLQPAGCGAPECETDLQQYEEIPANFETLPRSQQEKKMKYRPPAPPPVVTPPIEQTTRRVPLRVTGAQRQCGSADDVLLSTVDKLSVEEWAQSTLQDVDDDAITSRVPFHRDLERAVSSMTRKSSYEEDDVILIDSVIYSGRNQADNIKIT